MALRIRVLMQGPPHESIHSWPQRDVAHPLKHVSSLSCDQSIGHNTQVMELYPASVPLVTPKGQYIAAPQSVQERPRGLLPCQLVLVYLSSQMLFVENR